MRINYNTKDFCFLKDIESGRLDNLRCNHPLDKEGYDHCMNWLSKIWAHAAPRIRQNICMPCSTYIKAVNMSIPSFANLLRQEMFQDKEVEAREWVDTMTPEPLTEDEKIAEEAYKRLLGESYGCYLLGEDKSLLMVYGFHTEKDGFGDYAFHMFVIDGKMIACYAQFGEDYSYMASNGVDFNAVYVSCNSSHEVVSHIGYQRDMFIMFERYAKTETRIIPPSARFRYDMKSLSMSSNETKLKIQIRDSTYFTSIIRKGDFMVRGHLRLQRYKENGEWVRRLIYIDSFVKHGYTRQAKIAAAV